MVLQLEFAGERRSATGHRVITMAERCSGVDHVMDADANPPASDSISEHLHAWRVLPRGFYQRDPSEVARHMLGKILVHREDTIATAGRIVETEAYFGSEDPASRAYKGKKRYNEVMWGEAGRTFIYMVHSNWLFNVITGQTGEPGGVLVRALEPLLGIETMKERRKSQNARLLTSGPSRLTQALAITKEHHDLDISVPEGEIVILNPRKKPFKIAASHRIGVKRDLLTPLRFYVEGNPHVSR
ncbi:MAG: DNA-3-methyladenine glycosylase [Candidatus Geothermarchaeales archaeon]